MLENLTFAQLAQHPNALKRYPRKSANEDTIKLKLSPGCFSPAASPHDKECGDDALREGPQATKGHFLRVVTRITGAQKQLVSRAARK